MERKKIELLAPAGDMERLQMAAAYGADAVYLAGTTFGMRSFAGNFTPEALKEAVELCHRRGIRVHVTCNTMPRNNEVARLPEWLEYLDSLGVDAIASIPPIYFHLPEYGIAQYWNDISAAAPNTDFIIYNIPQLAGVALTIPLLKEMQKNPRVVAVKN